jgi:hypothetical protein
MMSDEQALRIARRMEALLLGQSKLGRQHQLKRMVRELVETLNGEHTTPTVKARKSDSGNWLIVDYCPYCAGAHGHEADGPSYVIAKCGHGGYVLEVKDE